MVQPTQDELTSFLVRVQPRLSRLALMLSGNLGDAEDLVQESLVRVVRRWSKISGTRDPEAYVCQIVINQWRDSGRRLLARPRAVGLDEGADDSGAEDLGEDSILDRLTMRDAVRLLTAKQRTVLYLRFYEDRSVREVAEVMGCSEGTVKSQTSYALRVLARSGALAPSDKR